MKKYMVTLGATVEAYAFVEIEANSAEEAEAKAQKTIKNIGLRHDDPEFDSELEIPIFNPEWETMYDYRIVNVQE